MERDGERGGTIFLKIRKETRSFIDEMSAFLNVAVPTCTANIFDGYEKKKRGVREQDTNSVNLSEDIYPSTIRVRDSILKFIY